MNNLDYLLTDRKGLVSYTCFHITSPENSTPASPISILMGTLINNFLMLILTVNLYKVKKQI